MDIKHSPTNVEKQKACEFITKALPLWFGQDKSNVQYAKDAFNYPALLIKDGDKDIALLVYKKIFDNELNKTAIDVHWLGILPEYHGNGIGKKLLKSLYKIADNKNIGTITVETLDPEVKNKSYLKTYAFYKSSGFSIYQRFSYNSFTQMVKMKKELK